MKDAARRLKVDKAYEFMKDCEFAMNAVMAAMKAVECASGVCNCFLRIWRGHSTHLLISLEIEWFQLKPFDLGGTAP